MEEKSFTKAFAPGFTKVFVPDLAKGFALGLTFARDGGRLINQY